ncbi:MAG: formylglycine-generating enzyme family protein [Saprospiraceae bacterium]
MTNEINNPLLISTWPEMLEVEGGTFKMGSTAYKSEQPIHEVTVPDFFMGKYPVTNAQYAVFLNDYQSDKVKGHEHEGEGMVYEHSWGIQQKGRQWQAAKGYEDHPVIYVTWYGAIEYCQWLSIQSGKAYRLPSESEWEYAASGGKHQSGFSYAGSNDLNEVGWYDQNSHDQTKPVGLKFPNELGLYDMSGNVWEWCADHWHDNYEGAPKDGSAWLTGGDSARRVVRGGSWDYYVYNCRVSYRFWIVADGWFSAIGFRVARY